MAAFVAAEVASGKATDINDYIVRLVRDAAGAAEQARLAELIGDGTTDRARIEQDVRIQTDLYRARNLPTIAERFAKAADAALETIGAGLSNGSPVGRFHTWPIKGFTEIAVYGTVVNGASVPVRVLHETRDLRRLKT